MNKIFSVITLVLFSLMTFAGNTFEGSLILNYSQGKEGSSSSKIKLTLKGDKVFIDPTVDPGMKTAPKMILNTATGDLYALTKNGEQKVAIKMNLKSLASIGGASALLPSKTLDVSNPTLKVKSTGKTKTISGYECTQYDIEDDENKGTAWITNDLGVTLASLFGNSTTGASAVPALVNGMPLEAKGTNTKTGENYNLNVEVAKEAVDDAVFKLPGDYMVMDISQMIDAMLKQQGPDAVKDMIQNKMLKQ